MNKQFKSIYKGKMYIVGRKILCDLCMRTIYDSRNYDPEKLFYTAKLKKLNKDEQMNMSKFHLCGTECARKLFDEFLRPSKEKVKDGEFSIETLACGDLLDYSKVPDGIPEDVYRKLQKEAH